LNPGWPTCKSDVRNELDDWIGVQNLPSALSKQKGENLSRYEESIVYGHGKRQDRDMTMLLVMMMWMMEMVMVNKYLSREECFASALHLQTGKV
jgi:hypothetical protein